VEPAWRDRLIALAVALMLLTLVRMIHVVGSIIVCLALIFGLGAWGCQIYRRYAQG
jgi:hypothetical protein